MTSPSPTQTLTGEALRLSVAANQASTAGFTGTAQAFALMLRQQLSQ